MHEENLHINPDPGKGYPQPDIPVDEAWKQMNTMLDNAMPSPSQNGKMKGSGGNFWTSTLLITGAAVVITWGLLATRDNRKVNTADLKNESVAETIIDSNRSSPAFSSEDSIIKSEERSATGIENPKIKNDKANYPDKTLRAQPEQNLKSKEKVIADSKVTRHQANTGTLPVADANESASLATSRQLTNVTKKDPGKTLNSGSDISGNTLQSLNDQSNKQATDQASSAALSAGLVNKHDYAENNGVLDEKDKENKTDTSLNQPVIIPALPTADSKTSDPDNLKNTGSNLADTGVVKSNFITDTHFGLSWNLPLPISGTDYYFSGYNGKSQPYMVLIPGAWVSKRYDKHEIMLQFSPFGQYFTGDKLVSSTVVHDSLSSDSIGLNQTSSVLKTFGISAALQYNYSITPSLIVGFGINYSTQRKALMQEITLNQSSGEVVSESLYGIQKSSGWEYLNSGFFSGKLEVAWRRKVFDLGVNFQLPLTNLSSSSDVIIKPLNGQLFIRLKIK